MALVICRDCKKEVSTDCPVCPNCGCKLHKSILSIIFMGFLVFLMLGLVASAFSPAPPSDTKTIKHLPVKGGTYMVSGNTLACRSRYDLDNLHGFAVKNEWAAVANYAYGKNCIPIDQQTEVVITETSALDSMVKIKLSGNGIEYWMLAANIDSDDERSR